MARFNIFQNFPDNNFANEAVINGNLSIRHFDINGSISFNNLAIIVTNNSTARSYTVSFGLYSLNGSTLSLANSASMENSSSSGLAWRTLVTSATQDITPGSWFFAFLASDGGGGGNLSFLRQTPFNLSDFEYGGPFFAGSYSVTTGGLPATIATSDMNKSGDVGGEDEFPYILITA